MPALDPLRRRISVTEQQLEVLRLVSNGGIAPDHDGDGVDGREDLVAAGLITRDGTVHRLVADRAAAMTQPILEL